AALEPVERRPGGAVELLLERLGSRHEVAHELSEVVRLGHRLLAEHRQRVGLHRELRVHPRSLPHTSCPFLEARRRTGSTSRGVLPIHRSGMTHRAAEALTSRCHPPSWSTGMPLSTHTSTTGGPGPCSSSTPRDLGDVVDG